MFYAVFENVYLGVVLEQVARVNSRQWFLVSGHVIYVDSLSSLSRTSTLGERGYG